MSYEIDLPDSAQQFVKVTHHGVVTKHDMLACRQAVFDTLSAMKSARMLVDFSAATEIPDADYFIMFFAMHAERLRRVVGIAVVHRFRDPSHVPRLGELARHYKINCRSFDDPGRANTWLADL